MALMVFGGVNVLRGAASITHCGFYQKPMYVIFGQDTPDKSRPYKIYSLKIGFTDIIAWNIWKHTDQLANTSTWQQKSSRKALLD